jgi:carbamoyltransferase
MWLEHKLCVPQTIRELTGYPGKVYFVDHHYAHAASAFLPSPFEEAIVLTMDGTGEWTTLAAGTGAGTSIRLKESLRFPHSLGLLYSAVTAHLGFKVNGGEGKVMALASYGKPSLRDAFSKLIEIREDGSFRLNLDYFSFHYDLVMTSPRFSEIFGPPRRHEEPILPEHQDLAAALQATVEDVVLRLVRHAHRTYGLDRLCLAGGVALNCVANGRILRETPIREIFVQPAAGDDGGAIGSALYLYTRLFGGRRRWRMRVDLGPSYSDAEIEAYLKRVQATYEDVGAERLPARVAELLAEGKIAGWFQGRMEYGPRALGNRSILADPRREGIQDVLNERVKHREPFRPFAPAVCQEDAGSYFDTEHPSPFMLLAVPVRAGKKAAIPGVVHVDGTARLQTVSEEEAPLFHRLLREFGRRTGVPVLLNTSFNIRGEPIVCSPQDAYEGFLQTEMDVLAMGRFVVHKTDAPVGVLGG